MGKEYQEKKIPTDMTIGHLALVAGQGALPLVGARLLSEKGIPFSVYGIEGAAKAQDFEAYDFHSVRLGAAGSALKKLSEQGTTHLLMLGGVKRPSLLSLKPDWETAKLLKVIGGAFLGDDSLLSAVMKHVESLGIRIISLQDISSSLLLEAGTYSRRHPNEKEWQDIKRGTFVTQQLGICDVGQGVIVQQNIVLAVEAIEGTDEMIRRSGPLKREGGGGVLVKLAKPEQDLRADLPTIGMTTIELLKEAGFEGLVIEENATFVLDFEALVEKANKAGLFFTVINPAKVISDF